MSYTIHIERQEPISLAEWLELVRTRTDLRLREADHSIRNPQTGELITIRRAEGETEVLAGDKWVSGFRWRKSGTIAFEAPHDFDEPENVIRRVALELAKTLSGSLVGEE